MRKTAQKTDQKGLSLIELMISLSIGLLLLAGLSIILVNSRQASAELQKSAQQIENGRYAIDIISQDLRHAGYYGYFYALPTPPGSLSDPCETSNTTTIYNGLSFPVQGYDSPTTSPISCLADADFVASTDILVIRRADTAVLASGSVATTNEVYLQGNSSTAEIQKGAGVAIGTSTKADGTTTATILKKDNVTAADIRKYHIHIYFVAPCSVPTGGGTSCTGATDDNGKPVPTLKRLELTTVGGTTTMKLVPLVEGIENFQVDYGLDTSPSAVDASTGLIGDGAPDSYTSTPSLANWPNVVTAKIYILARNTEATTGYTDGKTYAMGIAGTITPATAVQKYKRHLYSELVRLVNASSRRETPK